jgi:hypothetical protein
LELDGASSVHTARVGASTYLFVAGESDWGVSVFRVAADGTLTNTDNVSGLPGASSVHTAQVGTSTYLFAARSFIDGVVVFRVADDGTLVNVDNVSDGGTLELDGASSVHTAQIGANTYLFVAGYNDDGVSVFQTGRPANHNFTNALNVERGNSYSGNLIANSNDYYRIYLPAGTFRFSTSGETDTLCTLYRDNGNTQTQIGETDDNGGTGNNCSISYNVTTAGYYYIRIRGASSSITGDYTLRIGQ